jgi:hypothetical protein
VRVPILAGSRLTVVDAPPDGVVLRSEPPAEPITEVAAAVREALRFPLAGRPLEVLARRGGRATVVVQPPELPIPSAVRDPRQEALAATVSELERLGVPTESQTILVAGGLGRKAGSREVEALVPYELARRFRGRLEIHDVTGPLVDLGAAGRVPLRANRALVETDLVVVATAAESVLDGGPGALVAAGGPEALRAASAYSLLETAASHGWRIGVELERALAARVPLMGVSLALNPPAVTGAFQGYPHDPRALDRIATSPVRIALRLLPGAVRSRLLGSIPRELTVSSVLAGPPSVAHVEALLRAVESRAARLDAPLDIAVVGIPATTPHLPRERPNPVLAAYLGLGLALRLWRDAFPVADGGTAILVSPFDRRFPHPTQSPYRTFFNALRIVGSRGATEWRELAPAERAAAADERALDQYRSGRACHPLLPFVEWAGCLPAVERLGAVLVAGSRDAVAARQFGFVPTRNLSTALAMARARAGGAPRVGFLVVPPYFPIRTVGR